MEHETLSREEIAILLARPEKEAEMRREKVNTEGKEKLLEGIKRGIGQNIDAAFDRGYRKGYTDGYEHGHADGYEACKRDTELIPELKKEEYERGREEGRREAWEAARKIALTGADDCGIPGRDLREMFDMTAFGIFRDVDVDEVIERIAGYEARKEADEEIKVGDEIAYCFAGNKTRGVVLQVIKIDEGGYKVLCKNGCGQIIYKTENPRKTGKHYQQIAEVLEQMKGDTE